MNDSPEVEALKEKIRELVRLRRLREGDDLAVPEPPTSAGPQVKRFFQRILQSIGLRSRSSNGSTATWIVTARELEKLNALAAATNQRLERLSESVERLARKLDDLEESAPHSVTTQAEGARKKP